MSQTIKFNGAYLGHHDGTASWSECFLDAFTPDQVVIPGLDPTVARRVAFVRKIAYEASFRFRGGRERLHPYGAAALDRGASIVLLDAIGSGGNPRGWHPSLVRRSIRMARRLATISNAESLTLERVHQRPFHVLTPYPAVPFFDQPPAGPRREADGVFRIGYWGGWHPRKAIEEFLSAVTPRDDVRFVCTGAPVTRLRHREDITWLGRLSRQEQIRLVDSVDASLYPSTREGFGLPPYESLLRGRRVLLRALPCYQDFVDLDHPAVIVFAPEDSPDTAVERLRNAPTSDVRAALATPTLESARDRLSRQIEQWLTLET